MISLIATDIDGTLLDNENRLPAANRAAIHAAVAQGVRFALVTARKGSTTRRVADQVGVPCALIAHNGARIWDWDGTSLANWTLPLDVTLAVADFADEHAIPLLLTIDEVNYYGPQYPRQFGAATADDRSTLTNRAAVVGVPTRIITVGEDNINTLTAAFGTVNDTLVLHRYYTRLGAMYSAVITHTQANKATALATLCRHNAIAAEAVLALGDAEADVPMLRWAGTGVAMSNGMDEAIAAADWLAPPHTEEGFARAVERFVLGTY